MNSDLDGPPWFARHPDGTIHLGGVPERLQRHPKLIERGITLADSLKPGIVFGTRNVKEDFVVKVLDLATEELPIYERLLRHLDDSANHTVPAEIDCSEHPLLIMPMLEHGTDIIRVRRCKSQRQLLSAFYELVEGVDYLHQLHIAHMDLCCSNILVAAPRVGACYDKITPYRLYIIDFDTSRQFDLGPGEQHAIELPETQIQPPNGITHFNPYSWDVYCMGRVFEWLIEDYRRARASIPRIAQWYAKWLIGDERGCRGICHCQPTAWTARVVLALILLLGPLIDFYETVSSQQLKRYTS
ncbi:hypothetical protein PYCCODRAFT_1437208 [Trametes coccinea BRFM310]|uniref:Protein kinase domain-containing protein n=1 Tax=Trametes coccinea (strain BRFM310) TaxID=1353009 RepID=A0A1Y2IL03_TRAC3|nr:hypothetical protein PYCCODRAFT_1437208 [Trametes coccinea BRFM310]